VGGVAQVGGTGGPLGVATHGQDRPPTAHPFQRRGGRVGLRTSGIAIARREEHRGVPAQDLRLAAQLGQHAVDDSGGGLARPGAAQEEGLGEGDPRPPGPTLPRGLADQDHGGRPLPREVRGQCLPAGRGRATPIAPCHRVGLGVEIEGPGHGESGEAGHQPPHRGGDGRHRTEGMGDGRCGFGAHWPIMTARADPVHPDRRRRRRGPTGSPGAARPRSGRPRSPGRRTRTRRPGPPG